MTKVNDDRFSSDEVIYTESMLSKEERESWRKTSDEIKEEEQELRKYRVEALKIATQIAIKIEHFEPNYSSFEDPMATLLTDIEIVHKIADYNLKYIMGE